MKRTCMLHTRFWISQIAPKSALLSVVNIIVFRVFRSLIPLCRANFPIFLIFFPRPGDRHISLKVFHVSCTISSNLKFRTGTKKSTIVLVHLSSFGLTAVVKIHCFLPLLVEKGEEVMC